MPRQKIAATLVRPGQAGTWTCLVVARDRAARKELPVPV
jgi:hypothetical protein